MWGIAGPAHGVQVQADVEVPGKTPSITGTRSETSTLLSWTARRNEQRTD